MKTHQSFKYPIIPFEFVSNPVDSIPQSQNNASLSSNPDLIFTNVHKVLVNFPFFLQLPGRTDRPESTALIAEKTFPSNNLTFGMSNSIAFGNNGKNNYCRDKFSSGKTMETDNVL
ncbi:hypothetical protein AVEN_257381-1 [Araneus ventricosus]|uniref:Uncharacterized protein n=1 Tax=Araneus ventricosus TaxID=182803 RepID=A0A4Y2CAX8_ARAVE|nr:hypothetical protein AVEN_257381-1 [Araneus ventricosus]